MVPIKESDLSCRAFKANPYSLCARLLDDEPLCRIQLSDKRLAWLVTRSDDVALVLKDDRRPAGRTDPPQLMIKE
jgi:hypothetical protein